MPVIAGPRYGGRRVVRVRAISPETPIPGSTLIILHERDEGLSFETRGTLSYPGLLDCTTRTNSSVPLGLTGRNTRYGHIPPRLVTESAPSLREGLTSGSTSWDRGFAPGGPMVTSRPPNGGPGGCSQPARTRLPRHNHTPDNRPLGEPLE